MGFISTRPLRSTIFNAVSLVRLVIMIDPFSLLGTYSNGGFVVVFVRPLVGSALPAAATVQGSRSLSTL